MKKTMNNYSSFFILHYALTKVVAGFGRGLFFLFIFLQRFEMFFVMVLKMMDEH